MRALLPRIGTCIRVFFAKFPALLLTLAATRSAAEISSGDPSLICAGQPSALPNSGKTAAANIAAIFSGAHAFMFYSATPVSMAIVRQARAVICADRVSNIGTILFSARTLMKNLHALLFGMTSIKIRRFSG